MTYDLLTTSIETRCSFNNCFFRILPQNTSPVHLVSAHDKSSLITRPGSTHRVSWHDLHFQIAKRSETREQRFVRLHTFTTTVARNPFFLPSVSSYSQRGRSVCGRSENRSLFNYLGSYAKQIRALGGKLKTC